MNEIRRKVDLYILSLGLLFVFFIIITANFPVCFLEGCKFIGISEIISTNTVSVICSIMLLYCIFAYKRFSFDLAGAI